MARAAAVASSRDVQANATSPRRFGSAGAACAELLTGFNTWTKSLTEYGTKAAYALIAANWAVHGAAGKVILQNLWSSLSIGAAALLLAVHVLVVWAMGYLHGQRVDYAVTDPTRWEREFNDPKNITSTWPYTALIENLGTFNRWLLVVLVLVSGTCFIISLFA